MVKLIDGSGNTVVEYAYDSWGKQLSCTGTLATTLGVLNPFRYRGYVYDEETQWYYLRSRYYDPETCRFISADVLLSTGQGVIGNNSYVYCLNDPTILYDEDGAFGEELIEFWKAFTDKLASLARLFETAFIISQMDTPAIGIGDIGGGLFAGGLVITALFSVIRSTYNSGNIKALSKAKGIDLSIKKRRQYNYWEAELIKNEVVVSAPLTLI